MYKYILIIYMKKFRRKNIHRTKGHSNQSWHQSKKTLRPLLNVKKSLNSVRERTTTSSPPASPSTQDGESDPGLDEDGKSKLKRRPRPEPLIIPPPKPSTFIPPSLYPSITSYQSNLRSPVRLPDSVVVLPPYTPPPILSPVREGSGLYFSTFLTNIASNQSLPPPPPTPKSATRSLLRSCESRCLLCFSTTVTSGGGFSASCAAFFFSLLQRVRKSRLPFCP